MADISVFKMAPGKNDPPFNPYVQIYLSPEFWDNSNRILLSPKLMTEGEIDGAVDLLIKQLEKARKKAKKELQKA